ncbi:MAG TPA: diguanylate cyclase [Solirubrobacteraceae bacterium]
MSFRNRLALFFVLIVIVPMLAVTFLLFRLIGQSETGKSNAAIAAEHGVAQQLFREQRDLAQAVIQDVIRNDAVCVSSLQSGDLRRAAKRARQLVTSHTIKRIVLARRGRIVLQAGRRSAVAPAIRRVQTATKRSLGRLEVSVIDARTYAFRVRQITGLETVIRDGPRLLATTLPALDVRKLPLVNGEDVTVAGREYRVVSFNDRQGFTGQRLRVATLGTIIGTGDKIRDGRLTAAGILLGFFLIAIACAVLVSRTLQQQIAGFLAAARRLAAGDFSAKVPTVGHDEFAALGEEFNKMSSELEQRLRELSTERARVQKAMRRLGEAVASNLNRDALLELVVRTAVDGVGADAGRACVRTPDGTTTTLQERSRVGDLDGLEAAVESVEAQALRDGSPREVSSGSANAIAHPLRGADGGTDVVGVVSIGRSGRPFTPGDRDLFSYLAGQAARSIENVQLHETAARESITDDLTGLSNRRAFDDALTAEIERSKRYGDGLGLIILDLDDFKSVNDTYGHQQGDVVLREVARVLRETSREVDNPARYGGEELAVVVPGTDLDGTFNLAERMREGIGALRIPRVDGQGAISITTSCGVAAVPPIAADERMVLAAADAALYEAKRTGKNKSVRAR